jgi:hypothetical protein
LVESFVVQSRERQSFWRDAFGTTNADYNPVDKGRYCRDIADCKSFEDARTTTNPDFQPSPLDDERIAHAALPSTVQHV